MKYLIIGANSNLGLCLANCIYQNTGKKADGIFNNNYPKNSLAYNSLFQEKYIEKLDASLYSNILLVAAYIPNEKNPNIEAEVNKINYSNINLVERVVNKFSNSHIIFTSSTYVYQPKENLINEKSDLSPQNLYAESKLKGENIIKKINRYSILRLGSLIGGGMKKNHFLYKIIASSKNNKQILLYGDGSRLQSYIYIKDAAENIFSLSIKNEKTGIFNLVRNTPYSNKELAEEIIRSHPKTKIRYNLEDKSPSFQVSNLKLKSILKDKYKEEDLLSVINEIYLAA